MGLQFRIKFYLFIGVLRQDRDKATWYVSLSLSLLPFARHANRKMLRSIWVKERVLSKPLALREAAENGNARVCFLLAFFYKKALFLQNFTSYQNRVSRREGWATNQSASTKRVGRSAGRTSRGLSVRGKWVAPVASFRRKAFWQKLWSHAARKACPGTQYNGRVHKINSIQRVSPVA